MPRAPRVPVAEREEAERGNSRGKRSGENHLERQESASAGGWTWAARLLCVWHPTVVVSLKRSAGTGLAGVSKAGLPASAKVARATSALSMMAAPRAKKEWVSVLKVGATTRDVPAEMPRSFLFRSALFRFARLCSVLLGSALTGGELVPVETDGLSLLIAADTDGSIYCIANVCPHLGTPLDQGTVANGVIVCPLHKTAFSLKTGDVVGEWCPFPPILGPMVLGKLEPAKNVAIFPVRSSGSSIQVQVNKNLKSEFESNYWAGLLDAKGKATGEYY
eukprot:scaffold754_cov248-Pinguiococcus_pyrenoidosus.AAC.22